jgi:uncharacterized membrane protein YfcA
MPFPPPHYAEVSLVLFASSVVQGAIGFAAALFGTPLLVLCGMSFPDAVAISLMAAIVQNVIPAWQLRREIDFRGAIRPVLIRLVTLPLGVFALKLVGNQSKDVTSQIVGALVIAIVLVQWTIRAAPQPRLAPAWEFLAFGVGGFLLGFCGMGGPAMVLWVLAHDWPMNRARAFLFYVFCTGIPPQVFFLWLFLGPQIFGAMFLGLATLPAVLLGLYFGLLLSRLIPERVLRAASVAVLIVIATSAIAMPLFTHKRAPESRGYGRRTPLRTAAVAGDLLST